MANDAFVTDFLFRGSNHTSIEDIEITDVGRFEDTYKRAVALVGGKAILPDLSAEALFPLSGGVKGKGGLQKRARVFEVDIPFTAGDIRQIGQIQNACKKLCQESKGKKKKKKNTEGAKE